VATNPHASAFPAPPTQTPLGGSNFFSDADLAAIVQRQKLHLAEFPNLATSVFATADGRLRMVDRRAGSRDMVVTNTSSVEHLWYAAAITAQGPTWVTRQSLISPGTLTLASVLPIYQPQSQQLVGMFVTEIDMESIQGLLRRTDLQAGGVIALVGPQQQIVTWAVQPKLNRLLPAARHPAGLESEEAPFPSTLGTDGTLHDEGNPRSVARPHSDTFDSEVDRAYRPSHPSASHPPLPEGIHEIIRQDIVQRQEHEFRVGLPNTVRDRQGNRYRQYRTTWRDSIGRPWSVMLVVPLAGFQARFTNLALPGVAILLGMSGGALALGTYLSRRLVQPVQALRQGVRAIASGHFDRPLPQFPCGDYVELAQDIERLGTCLRETFQTLHLSERKFSAAIHHLPMGVCVLNPLGQMVFANNAARQILRLTAHPDHAPFEPSHFYVADTATPYPVDRLPVVCALRGAAAHADDVELERNGERIALEVSAMPVRDRQGQLMYVIHTFQDIRDRRRAERVRANYERQLKIQVREQTAALRQRQVQLESLAAASPGIIYSYVRTTRGEDFLEFISPAVYSICEVDVDAAIANPLALIVGQMHPDDRADYIAAVNDSYAKLSQFAHEWRIITPSGKLKWLRASSQSVRRSNGDVCWYGVALDISDRKRSELALQAANSELEATIAAIPDLVFRVRPDGMVSDFKGNQMDKLYVPPSFFLQQRIQDVLPPPAGTQIYAKVVQAFTEKQPIEVDYNLLMPNGMQYYEARIVPFRDDEAAVVVRNVTAKQQSEQALREGEARFRSAFDDAATGMALISPSGRILRVNTALSTILGYAESDLLTRPFKDFLCPVEAPLDWEAIANQLRGDQRAYQLETRAYHASRSFRWVLLSISLVRNSDYEALYFVVQVQDVTERRQMEAALRESEERFRRSFEDAAVGMGIISPTGQILQTNRALNEMLGYSAAELQGRSIASITHPEDYVQEQQHVAAALARKIHAWTQEKRYLRADGSSVWVLLSVSLVRDREGLPLYFIGQAQDISERLASERVKDEFISIVSHELRTPLTAIRGSLGLLASGVYQQRPDRAQRMIDIALMDTDRLARLVNDILDLERLESGRIGWTLTPCDVGEMIQDAAASMQAIAQAADISVMVCPISQSVLAHRDAIIQTLNNLINNAIKFSDSGQSVEVAAQFVPAQTYEQDQAPHGWIEFWVRDHGRGIPADKLDLVFERFQQVDVSDSRQKGGTGLGLAICRTIVQQHGGTIWVESDLGSGSTFHFTLPCTTSEPSGETGETGGDRPPPAVMSAVRPPPSPDHPLPQDTC
jgi:PAS domain S-box-containing protein